jgi:dihydrofolate reductase
MRKAIFAMNLSLDGCCDHTKFNPDPDDELMGYFAQLVRELDVFAYGRKTYELMVPFWPEVAKNHSGPTQGFNDYAQAFASVGQMVVFSRNLEKVEGKNARIVRTNMREEILKLKQEEGKSIGIGGVNILSQLIGHDLVDEYRLVVHPILVGEGRRLLEGMNLQESVQLKLVDSRTFKSGAVALHYSKRLG